MITTGKLCRLRAGASSAIFGFDGVPLWTNSLDALLVGHDDVLMVIEPLERDCLSAAGTNFGWVKVICRGMVGEINDTNFEEVGP